jgi:hypothetical protein
VSGTEPSGFFNVAISFKRQFAVPFGFDLSTTAGIGFPTGSGEISLCPIRSFWGAPGEAWERRMY